MVLDLACGAGRHSRLFLDRGHPVIAVDRDVAPIREAHGHHEQLTLRERDLEDGQPIAELDERYAAVVVVNYLHRPLLPALRHCLLDKGVLIYETFAKGNERHGKPSNPAFLLLPGELRQLFEGHLKIIAFEDVEVDDPKPAVVQRICAINQLDD